MKYNFNFALLVLSLIIVNMGCEDVERNIFGNTEDIYFIYTTPSVGDSTIEVSVTRAGSYYEEGTTFDNITLSDAEISIENQTTGVTISNFKTVNVDNVNQDVSQNIRLFSTAVDEDFLQADSEVILSVTLDNQELAMKSYIVPKPAQLVEYSIDQVANLVIPGRGFNIPTVVELSVTLRDSPTNYFRIKAYTKRPGGQYIKSATALQKRDEALFSTGVTDINVSNTSPIKRYTSDSYHNWLFSSTNNIGDEQTLVAHFWDFQLLGDDITIVVSPITKEVFEAELNSIVDNDTDNFLDESSQYPTDLECDNCLGNFIVINPLIIR